FCSDNGCLSVLSCVWLASETILAAPVMEYAGLEILPERRELRVDGRTIALGGRAFDVVRVLVEAQGKLVSKDEILKRVWPNAIVEENSLQVTVSALRKALGGRRNAIHTVSGRGYQIVARLAAERSRPPTNLPAPNCELIGREGVLDEIAHLAESHRVVTLTGAGGMGKTRLAFEAARRLLPRFPDGVWVVELATTGDGAAVPHLVASAVG